MRRDLVAISSVPGGTQYTHYKGQHENGRYQCVKLLRVVAEVPLRAGEVEQFRRGRLQYDTVEPGTQAA